MRVVVLENELVVLERRLAEADAAVASPLRIDDELRVSVVSEDRIGFAGDLVGLVELERAANEAVELLLVALDVAAPFGARAFPAWPSWWTSTARSWGWSR